MRSVWRQSESGRLPSHQRRLLYGAQRDFIRAADDEEFVLALEDAGQQCAVEEDLGGGDLGGEDVVAELAGALAVRGE